MAPNQVLELENDFEPDAAITGWGVFFHPDLIRTTSIFEKMKQMEALVGQEFATGLAYVDVKQSKTTDIVIGMDGEPWIDTTRQKTDAPTRIPLLPTALKITEKYKDHPQCCAAGVVLPVPSNHKNAYLKESANLCGISKTLTFQFAGAVEGCVNTVAFLNTMR